MSGSCGAVMRMQSTMMMIMMIMRDDNVVDVVWEN